MCGELRLACRNGNKTFKTYLSPVRPLLKVQGSHHRVVQLMGEAALRGQVTMILRRKMQIRAVGGSNGMQSTQQQMQQQQQQHIRYPYDVIVSRNENEGFGFVISSSQYYGSTIGKIFFLYNTYLNYNVKYIL